MNGYEWVFPVGLLAVVALMGVVALGQQLWRRRGCVRGPR